LNTITTVSLSIPLVGLVLQSIKKCRVCRHKHRTSRKKTSSIYTFVFFLAILVFRLLAVNLGLIYYTNGCPLSIVCSLIAKQILAPSRAASANSSPASLKKTSNRVVFQTNRTPLAASAKINSIILIYTLNLILLVLITSFVFLYYRANKVLPVYYTSVPYKINRSMQVIIAFFSKKARGLFFVRVRLRIY
jgi:hypothetical protein